MAVQDIHVRSLQTSTLLSGYYMERAILPVEVIAVLNREKIKFMLVGAHGIGGWIRRPRATEDVDIVVAGRHVKKAVRVLVAAFPQLEVDDQEVVTRLRDKETHDVRIDVMKPNQPLFREALKHTHTVRSAGQEYEIPSLEMALAMKFAPMISLTRSDERKYMDASDFMTMIKANQDIDLLKLAQLGELVYAGGGQEIVEKVRQVRAGEKLTL